MKKFKYLFILVATLVVGIVATDAAVTTQIILSKTNYSINPGMVIVYQDLNAKNDYARASLGINSTTGTGPLKANFKGYKKGKNGYTLKTGKTHALCNKCSLLIHIGKIESGNWKIANESYNGATNYVGWSGTIQYMSTSAE